MIMTKIRLKTDIKSVTAFCLYRLAWIFQGPWWTNQQFMSVKLSTCLKLATWKNNTSSSIFQANSIARLSIEVGFCQSTHTCWQSIHVCMLAKL